MAPQQEAAAAATTAAAPTGNLVSEVAQVIGAVVDVAFEAVAADPRGA
jgi:hypothetical protein